MADKYTEKENHNAEQNAQRSNRPANMLECIERERQQFKTDLMQGIREAFAESIKHHYGDTSLAFRHLHLVTTKRFALDRGLLFKLAAGVIAEAIYDELTDKQKEDLRKDTDF
jgi:hypothetical protein